MIKLTDDFKLPSVPVTDGFSVTKIKANFLAYGCGYSFLKMWFQQNENSEITALLQKFENTFFIVAKENADFSEIKDFIFMIGFSSLQAEPKILAALNLKFKEYSVLEYIGTDKADLPPYPDIKEVYSLLFSEESPSLRPTDFEAFYVDLSHKIRKNLAAALTLNKTAVCVASHITDSSAVISGVAVQSGARGGGLGSQTLRRMLTSLGERKIYVAAEEKVVPFYIKNGFLKAYKTAIYETEDN